VAHRIRGTKGTPLPPQQKLATAAVIEDNGACFIIRDYNQ
jgi:hypothetical protein